MRLVRRAELTPQPWRNGGGVTWQIAAGPDGADVARFDWRLSMAEVAADGPFSAFAGIDRTLTLLQGAGLELDFGGAAVRLVPGDAPLSFPGDAAVTGRLSGGPVTDLNVMTRRGRCRADVKVWRYAVDWPSTPPHAALLLAVQGDWRCAVAGDAPTLLTPGSGLWWAPAAARPAISVQPQPGVDDPALLAVMIEHE